MAELKLAVRLDSLGLPLKRGLDVAARLGVRGVELNARGEVHPEALSETGLRHLRKMLEDRNLSVAALRFQTRRGYENPQDLQRRVEATKSAMSLAYKLGAPAVINSIGYVSDDKDDPRYNTLQAVIEDLGRFGARVGAFLAAETGAESGETLSEILGESEDGFVAVAFNPGQLIVNRHSVLDAVRVLKDRIVVVCATDGVVDLAAGRGIRVPIGEGTADFPQILATLEDSDFRGPVIVGRSDATLAELDQGVQYLTNL
ncbi:sugar phosphate isomerase/epimerase [Roseiconus nitratireducens]|uniref:Sugar phosphate isomerase/epimerase n=1 Tax=Roseiconus nitratireducens TaxID=2605748 RepID=A0A5M6DFD4_9BACT|nr:sugar phosphate isomerase/epimerase family protein [Roseiconus nitratireducens]KAA5546103.1 sugar phosphate isomerase/epimerase [Roseiconus nitratireducens]